MLIKKGVKLPCERAELVVVEWLDFVKLVCKPFPEGYDKKKNNMMTKEEKAQEIINTSGNNFHYKVIGYFRSTGWTVLVSPYYTDNYSDKPREIDLLAEKDIAVSDCFGHQVGYIKVKLFVECKYIASENVFWFDDKDRDRAVNKVISTTPLGDPKQWHMTNDHHYLKDTKVAKIFSGGKSSENDVFYKATSQCLNALVGNFRQPNIIERSPGITSCAILNYPVIVCNSFEKIFKSEDAKPKAVTGNFQLEVNYAYTDYSGAKKREYFIIDVVCFDEIADLVSEIENKDVTAVREKVLNDSD